MSQRREEPLSRLRAVCEFIYHASGQTHDPLALEKLALDRGFRALEFALAIKCFPGLYRKWFHGPQQDNLDFSKQDTTQQ